MKKPERLIWGLQWLGKTDPRQGHKTERHGHAVTRLMLLGCWLAYVFLVRVSLDLSLIISELRRHGFLPSYSHQSSLRTYRLVD